MRESSEEFCWVCWYRQSSRKEYKLKPLSVQAGVYFYDYWPFCAATHLLFHIHRKALGRLHWSSKQGEGTSVKYYLLISVLKTFLTPSFLCVSGLLKEDKTLLTVKYVWETSSSLNIRALILHMLCRFQRLLVRGL